MVNDNELQAAILEETMKEIKQSNDPSLVTDVLHNLGEMAGMQGQMSKAYKVNKERDDSYIDLYSTFDGTVSTVLKTMAPKLLRKRIPNIPEAPREKWGQLAFSLSPVTHVERAKFLCDLHPENAKREWLDSIGLSGRFCPKANLSSPYEVLRHRRSYHHDEDAAITAAELRQREEQNLEYQRNIAEILADQAKRGRRNAE